MIVRYNIPQADESPRRVIMKLPEGNDQAVIDLFPDAAVEEINQDNIGIYEGVPLIFPITFQGGTYKQYDRGKIVDTEMKEFRLPLTTICQFSRDKKMDKTYASAGFNSWKEIYSIDDWQIRMDGVIFPDDTQPQGYTTPAQQIKMLRRWDDLPAAIKVESDLFALLGIHNIVMKLQLGQTRAFPERFPFTITAESDAPVELILE